MISTKRVTATMCSEVENTNSPSTLKTKQSYITHTSNTLVWSVRSQDFSKYKISLNWRQKLCDGGKIVLMAQSVVKKSHGRGVMLDYANAIIPNLVICPSNRPYMYFLW